MCFRSKPTQFSKTIYCSTREVTERIRTPAHDGQRFFSSVVGEGCNFPRGKQLAAELDFHVYRAPLYDF